MNSLSARVREARASSPAPEILARGPWALEQITARWREEPFEPSAEHTRAADAAIRDLQDRGSPSHDGVAARLVDYREDDDGIAIELQPLRWALRLVPDDASHSLAALCVTRSADGRWLAGRRAPWVSSWAGRWALGAGGAVDLGESPADTLVRELREEWAVVAGARPRRGAAAAAAPARDVRRARRGWPRARSSRAPPTTSTTHSRGGRARSTTWPAEAGEALPRMARWLSM